MKIASARGIRNAGGFEGGWAHGHFNWILGNHSIDDGYPVRGEIPTNPNRLEDAVIFVHGYNSDQIEVWKAFQLIEENLKKENLPIIMYGFSWPSQGNTVRYHRDLINARRSIHALENLVRHLHSIGHSRVNIVCHSMGTEVTMTYLKRVAKQGQINRVCIHGGDALWSRFKSNRRYGKGAGPKIMGLLSMWSENDLVLNFAAPIGRPRKRIGNNPMPSNSPDHFIGKDANDIFPGKAPVRHSTYKASPDILRATIHYLLKGELRVA